MRKKSDLIKLNDKVDLIYDIFKYDVILFPMGINNGMSKGIAYQIALNFPIVKESENETGYGDRRKLGTIHETQFGKFKFIACYIHEGGYKKNSDGSYLNHQSLEDCLTKVRENYGNKKIATVLMGSNESDGLCDEGYILATFIRILQGCDVTIYTKKEKDYRLEIFKEIAKVREQLKNKEITRKEYFKIRSEIEWRRKNGIFSIMPEEYIYVPKKAKSKLLFRGSKKQQY
jgi:hypothetical protein